MEKINFKEIVDLAALLEQLEQLNLDDWSHVLFDKAYAAKKQFHARWQKEFFSRFKEASSFFEKIKVFWNYCIIQSPKRALESQFRHIEKQYREYLRLKDANASLLKRLDGYPVFSSLGAHSQQIFKRIYFFLKLIEAQKFCLKKKLSNSLSHLCSPRHAMQIFHAYECSLNRECASHKMREELHCLGFVVTKYRAFFLDSHPDPYIRSRWGFPQEVTGEEPELSHALAELSLRLEKLDRETFS